MSEIKKSVKVKDWIQRYLRLHSAAYKNDWPEGGSEDYTALKRLFQLSFARHRVTEAEAVEAVVRLTRNPPQFRSDHIEKVLGEVDAIRREADEEASRQPLREPSEGEIRAKRLSLDCPLCQGVGTVRYPCRPVGSDSVWPTTFFCRCAFGRCLSAKADADGVRPYENLQDHPDLWRRDLNHDTWIWTMPVVDAPRDWEPAPSEPTASASPSAERSGSSAVRQLREVVTKIEPTGVSREEFDRRKAEALEAIRRRAKRSE